MKKNRFIEKLVRKESIKLAQPSKIIAEDYDKKAKNSLKSAKILLEQQLYEEATAMSYYAMYHKTTSLFFLVGIKCENHAGTIILLKELFGIDNETITEAKKERIHSQYYTDNETTKESSEQLIKEAEEYLDELDYFIDTLTKKQQEDYRATFARTYTP
jgi:uncharacterized protein (UPF0332 family)